MGCRGLSVHVYNDGGVFGGFGEPDCNGRTIGGKMGASGSDEFAFWFFKGAEAKVRRLSEALLGHWATGSLQRTPTRPLRTRLTEYDKLRGPR